MPTKPQSKPQLPKRTVRNRPAAFTESLSVPFQATLAVPAMASPRLSSGQRQGLVMTAWVAACIALGVAYGVWLNSRTTTLVMPGLPVAQATVAIVAIPETDSIFAPVAAAQPSLAVTSSAAVRQATAGTPLSTGSLGLYQGALTGAALQPGFLPFGYPQGTIGTDAVR